jgi:hypothetical protein
MLGSMLLHYDYFADDATNTLKEFVHEDGRMRERA